MNWLIVLVAGLTCIGVAAADEWIYVVQQLDETLGLVRLPGATGTVEPLGALCNGITQVGSALYVTNATSLQEIIGDETQRDMALPGCGGPWASAPLNSDTLAVSCSTSDRVALLRLSTGTVVGQLEVGNAPEGLLVHGDNLLVTLTRLEWPDYGPGVVMVYNRHTLALVDSIQVGTNPQAMAVDQRGRLHIVCTGNYGDIPGQINVVDATTFAEISVLPTGGTPADVAIGVTYAYVAAGGWGDHGHVYRYTIEDLQIVNGADNPLLVGSGVSDICVTIGETWVVSCFMTDHVEQRTADGLLLGTYDVGDGPGNMVYGYSFDAPEPPTVSWAADPGLTKAYPNPFNSAVTLRWDLPLRDLSSMLIYNALGRIVDRLTVGAGMTSVSWVPRGGTLSNGSSGVYFASWGGSVGGPPLRIVYLK